jgi:protein-S-isoprenylcysteine O-methyltransferase Ste14
LIFRTAASNGLLQVLVLGIFGVGSSSALAAQMMVRLGNFFFRYRNGLFPFAFLLVFLPGAVIFTDPLLAVAAGFCVALLGQSLRAATIGLEYIVRGGRDRRVYAEGLVTQGLYGHCRNPMYVGNLFILIGMALASNSWGCVAVAVPLFGFIYAAIVAAEEGYLLGKFGTGFREYMAAVPRWLPRLRGLGATFADSQFHWRRALIKEYGTPFGWLMGMPALALWNLWRAGYWELRPLAVEAMFGSMLVTVVIWGLIRALKKSRTLVAD